VATATRPDAGAQTSAAPDATVHAEPAAASSTTSSTSASTAPPAPNDAWIIALTGWGWAYKGLVLASGIAFALWPLLFFEALPDLGRLMATLVLAAMAGAAAAVLSVRRWLALAYCGLLLLPPALLLINDVGLELRICGAIGLIYWLSIAFSVNRLHLGMERSLELVHRNAALVRDMNRQSRELVEANAQLASADQEMRRTNQALEQRILERTAELHRLATRDALTGLANRTHFMELAEAQLVEGNPPSALFFVDLDGFKEINDSMGHAVGDAVLYEVARRLAEAAGGAIALSRWGGDEFVLLRRSCGDIAAESAFAETLLEALRAPVEDEPFSVRVDACIGIAVWPRDGESLQELIYGADMAVYAAKAAGRGKVRGFTDALAAKGKRHAQIRKALALSLTEGCQGLSLVYQPVFEIASRRVSAVEALLRWEHAELGRIGPGEFIPLAESTGDIIALGDWVLHEACRFAAGFPRERLPALCVNVSVQQLLYPDFVEHVKIVLSDSGLAADRLVLELTESIFIPDFDQIGRVFSALHGIGVRLAIDDFGTGYSSLAYLQRVPASTLKVDGSFVAALDSGGRPIIAATVSLARAFGMRVVAEGVETDAQLHLLAGLGIDQVQGYLLARPQSADDLRALLLTETRSRQMA
jgi:diguanylate cyclase (GGDEF)-like protein